MGARSGGRAASAWFGLLLVLLLVSLAFIPLVAAGEDEDGEPVEEILYFTQRPRGDPEYNFSTYAPKIEETTVREGVAGGGFGLEVSWGWRIPTAPDNWSIGSGDTWNVILHISGWDEHIPLASPVSNPDAIGQNRIQVNVTLENSVVASGSIYRDADPFNDEVTRVSIPIEFIDSFDFKTDGSSGTMLLDILVTGRRINSDATMDLHFGSTEFTSRIEAPGYPVENLRIWEDLFLWDQYCTEKQLNQETCEKEKNGPPPTNGGPVDNGKSEGNSTGEGATVPAPSTILISSLALGFILLIAFVRQGRKN